MIAMLSNAMMIIVMMMMMTIAIMMIVMMIAIIMIAIMLSNAMMMMTAAGCTAFLPWAAFVKCHRGAKFTFTNDSTPAPQPHYITFTFNVKNVKILKNVNNIKKVKDCTNNFYIYK